MHAEYEYYTVIFFEHVRWFLPSAAIGVALGFLLGSLCAMASRALTKGRCRSIRIMGLIVPWRAAMVCSPLMAVPVVIFIRHVMDLNVPVVGLFPGLLMVAFPGLLGAWGGTWGTMMGRDCPRPWRVSLASRLRTLMIVCVVAGGMFAGLVGAGGLGGIYMRGLQMVIIDLLLRSAGLFFLIAAALDLIGGLIASMLWKPDRPVTTPIQ